MKALDCPIKKHGGCYAINREREKAQDLAHWVSNKLQKLSEEKENVTLDHILDYKQTVLNYGLG